MEKKGKTENNKVVQPYDYDDVIKYHTAAELRRMGLGSGEAPVGSDDVKKDKKDKEGKKDKKSKAKSEEDFDKEV